MEKHGYVVYMVGAPNKEGKKPILIRVDSKWAHTHYGQYSGGNKGNGDKMVKTYFAVVRNTHRERERERETREQDRERERERERER